MQNLKKIQVLSLILACWFTTHIYADGDPNNKRRSGSDLSALNQQLDSVETQIEKIEKQRDEYQTQHDTSLAEEKKNEALYKTAKDDETKAEQEKTNAEQEYKSLGLKINELIEAWKNPTHRKQMADITAHMSYKEGRKKLEEDYPALKSKFDTLAASANEYHTQYNKFLHEREDLEKKILDSNESLKPLIENKKKLTAEIEQSKRNFLEKMVETFCFAAGTRVKTAHGLEAIETLKVGDTVISCDFAAKKCALRPILRTMVSEAHIIDVKISGQTIQVTPNHPFYIAQARQFIPAAELQVGDHILSLNGEELAVEAIDASPSLTPQLVYNLEVDADHNYYVSSSEGEQNLLVHNCNEHDCTAFTDFADTAKDMYQKMALGAGAACAISAAGCAGSLVTPGGQVIAAGACPATIPLCELAASSAAAGIGAELFGTMMNEATEKGKSGSTSRYQGPKPKYHVNPAHVPGQKGFNPKKTPLPKDADSVFKNAVPNDPKNPTAWFGKNSDGKIYRYSMSNDGTAHFSGIDGVGDGIRNLTPYAKNRLNN